MPFTPQQLEILSEKTLQFLLIFKKDSKIIASNNRCEVLFSQPKGQIKGLFITDFIIDEDVQLFKDIIASLSKNNTVASKSFCFATEDHGVLSVKFNFTFDENLIYATGIDTTEEYKEHRALMTISKLTKTGAWYYNPKNKDMYWSEGCYLVKDLDPEVEMTRELGASFYPKENRKRVENYLTTLIATKQPYEYIEKIITAIGNEKWVKVIAHPVIHKNEVVYVNGTIADITDHHDYVEKLKHNEETKHLALKGIQSGLFDHIIDTNMVFFSTDFKKMLGLPLEQDFALEDEFKNMIHPEDIEGALRRHRDNLNKKGNHYFNYYRMKHKKGSYRYYEVHGFRRKNEKNETTRMIGNLIDVHQRKLNERTIIEGKSRLQAIVNNGFAYTVLLDTKGKILMTDKKSLKIIRNDFNVDPTKTDCLFVNVMPINFKSSFVHTFNEALKGNTLKKEIERITDKGHKQWLETKYTPIFDHDYKINSVLVSFHDISERKLAEQAITEAHIREQELSNLKSNILSNFSHEIRTPLNGIMTISNLILEDKYHEDKNRLLNYLEESKDRLLETMNKLSNFSEINVIQDNLNFEEVDLNYVVETSFREHKYMADTKKLEYILELDIETPQVKLDVNLFQLALNNIIHNAIKYTKKGKVTIKVDSNVSKKYNYIYVKDTGIGIAEKNLIRIFEPLVQGSNGISREYEGTGIGLSLSKRYIEILNGKIKLKSKLGKGTKFIILIPKCV